MHELFVSDWWNLLAKVHLSIHDTSDQIKEALLTMENITLVINSVSNFILEVKENDADEVFVSDNKQLLEEVEHDIMNYQNRGLCYLFGFGR